MARGRKPNPATPYTVYMHRNGKYHYAAVQRKEPDSDTGKLKYKILHLGTVNENLVFTPNPIYRLMEPSERTKYVFPPGWDISRALAMNTPAFMDVTANDTDVTAPDTHMPETSQPDTEPSPAEKVDPVRKEGEGASGQPWRTTLDQYNNRLYGGFWLLENIAAACGLYDDLLKAFRGNGAKANEVMSLAFFPYLSGRNFNRFAKWQLVNKTLLDYQLKAPAITRLTQSITDDERMRLIRCRLDRLPKHAVLDCDSTTRSCWGRFLVDIHWGHNKDNAKLCCTVEVFVYSLATHEPVYYRCFPGNVSDMSTIRTILADLKTLGIENVVFMADRGYTSDENLAALVAAGLPFTMCAKVGTSPVVNLLLDIEYDRNGLPIKMEYDKSTRLYYLQVDIPRYSSSLSDGTIVEMEGLKANLFMNHYRRGEGLSELKVRIDKEQAELDAARDQGLIPEDIGKYNALFDYFKVTMETDENKKPVGIRYARNESKIRKEEALCGFFSSVIYKQEMTAKEAYCQYKTRGEHEENFNQMKNQLHYYVQRNSSEEAKNGRAMLVFVGLIPVARLKETWSSKMQGEYESTLDMLDEMAPIRFSEYTDGSCHMTTFTMKQVAICEACGITPPEECLPSTVRKAYERKANPKKRGRKTKTPINPEDK